MPPFCGWTCLSPRRPDLGQGPSGHWGSSADSTGGAPWGVGDATRQLALSGPLGCWASQGPGRVRHLPTSQGLNPGPVCDLGALLLSHQARGLLAGVCWCASGWRGPEPGRPSNTRAPASACGLLWPPGPCTISLQCLQQTHLSGWLLLCPARSPHTWRRYP